MATGPRHRIHVVAELVGVPPVTLRAWERRYGVPRPARGGSQYRLYSDDDVALLRQLVALRDRGVTVGEAAREVIRARRRAPRREGESDLAPVRRRIFEAAKALRADELRAEVSRALLSGDPRAVFDDIFAPVLHAIGDGWARGEVGIASEHLASMVLGAATRAMSSTLPVPARDRVAIVACFADEEHAVAAAGVALHLGAAGYRVVDLGPRTPPDALADAVSALRPELIALSVTVPPRPARAAALVAAYGRAAGSIRWCVGGAGSPTLAAAVTRAGGEMGTVASLTNIGHTLYKSGSPRCRKVAPQRCSMSSSPRPRAPRSTNA